MIALGVREFLAPKPRARDRMTFPVPRGPAHHPVDALERPAFVSRPSSIRPTAAGILGALAAMAIFFGPTDGIGFRRERAAKLGPSAPRRL